MVRVKDNVPPALYRLREKTHTAGPYGLFRKWKSPYQAFSSPVWVFYMSRYRAGGLLIPSLERSICNIYYSSLHCTPCTPNTFHPAPCTCSLRRAPCTNSFHPNKKTQIPEPYTLGFSQPLNSATPLTLD